MVLMVLMKLMKLRERKEPNAGPTDRQPGMRGGVRTNRPWRDSEHSEHSEHGEHGSDGHGCSVDCFVL
jgi:hypothetical protein